MFITGVVIPREEKKIKTHFLEDVAKTSQKEVRNRKTLQKTEM
jgi:hypothetical protein